MGKPAHPLPHSDSRIFRIVTAHLSSSTFLPQKLQTRSQNWIKPFSCADDFKMASAALPVQVEHTASPRRPSREPPAPPNDPSPVSEEEPVSDIDETPAAVANGVSQARASPSPNVPNGKPTSPYVKESNPMGSGAAQTVSSKDPKAAAQAASDMRNVVRRKLTGYVGFANLPNQWHRKSVRKGFNFNVMVVGMFYPRRLVVISDTCR